MYRYYSLKRPIIQGGLPRRDIIIKVENFDKPKYCEEVNRKAYAYVEYKEDISKQEADAYELVISGTKDYYCVVSSYDDKGKSISAVSDVIYTNHKPENSFKSLKHSDVYTDWFDNKEEAIRFVEESTDYTVRRSKLLKRVSDENER